MNLKMLKDTPPWDWPKGARATILATLRDLDADESERLLATELAGEVTVIDDEIARMLLAGVVGEAGSLELRGSAAISLGPALEHANLMEFDDVDDILLTEKTVFRVQQTFRELYDDAETPDSLRRRILEASVRAPRDWHRAAIAAAHASDAHAWRLTAVFCMRFVRGFDDQILAALSGADQEVRYHAICAAGNWEIAAAWPRVCELAVSGEADKSLRLAAIEAVASIRPEEAGAILGPLTDLEDDDLVDAAHEALAMAGTLAELGLDEADDEEEK